MKILVRGTNWIGDAVMSVPALRELRTAFPEARITLQSRPAAAAVFEDASFIDDVLIIEPHRSKVSSIIAQARAVRRQRFDLGIIFTNSVEAAAVQRLASIPARFGYETSGRRSFLTHAVPVPEWKSSRHEVYYYLNLVSEVARSYGRETILDETLPFPVLSISPERLAFASAQLAELGVDGSRPLVALGIGSTNSRAKRWPADRYAKLAQLLTTELGAVVVLIGSGGDVPVAEEVRRLAGLELIDLCGRTSVSEAAAILARIDLLISNDMGLAHLAPAVGTSTIVIFGPTDDVTTRPFSDNAEVIRHPVECSPCMLRDCPIDHRCMTGVSVELVFERAAARLLER